MIRASISIDPNRFDNPVHQGMYVLQALQQAGVPATGVLYVAGVESGVLTISAPDLTDGLVAYEWSEG